MLLAIVCDRDFPVRDDHLLAWLSDGLVESSALQVNHHYPQDRPHSLVCLVDFQAEAKYVVLDFRREDLKLSGGAFFVLTQQDVVVLGAHSRLSGREATLVYLLDHSVLAGLQDVRQ